MKILICFLAVISSFENTFSQATYKGRDIVYAVDNQEKIVSYSWGGRNNQWGKFEGDFIAFYAKELKNQSYFVIASRGEDGELIFAIDYNSQSRFIHNATPSYSFNNKLRYLPTSADKVELIDLKYYAPENRHEEGGAYFFAVVGVYYPIKDSEVEFAYREHYLILKSSRHYSKRVVLLDNVTVADNTKVKSIHLGRQLLAKRNQLMRMSSHGYKDVVDRTKLSEYLIIQMPARNSKAFLGVNIITSVDKNGDQGLSFKSQRLGTRKTPSYADFVVYGGRLHVKRGDSGGYYDLGALGGEEGFKQIDESEWKKAQARRYF